MSKKFKDDYGVYVSTQVFENKGPVLEAVRDSDGYWQFFTGEENDLESDEPRLIGVGRLTSLDPTIHKLTELNPGQYAERQSIDSPWKIGNLDLG